MIIRIRYEDEMRPIELDVEEVKGKWLSIDLEDDLPEDELQRRVQEAVDKQYNRPEYNVLHRETRHIDATPKRKRMDGKRGYLQADRDDKEFDIMDYLQTVDDIKRKDHDFEYQEICTWIREVLAKKPKWADAFIAVRLDGMSVNDYAASIVFCNPFLEKVADKNGEKCISILENFADSVRAS